MKIAESFLFRLSFGEKLRRFSVASDQRPLPFALCQCRTSVHESLCAAGPRSLPSISRRHFPRGDIQGSIIVGNTSVQYAAPECCDIHFARILRIRNHAIAPFEVEARNARPVFATVWRAP